MNDFFTDLKDIKSEMMKNSKLNDKKKALDKKPELVIDKEKSLKDEFLEFIKYSDVKKIH